MEKRKGEEQDNPAKRVRSADNINDNNDDNNNNNNPDDFICTDANLARLFIYNIRDANEMPDLALFTPLDYATARSSLRDMRAGRVLVWEHGNTAANNLTPQGMRDLLVNKQGPIYLVYEDVQDATVANGSLSDRWAADLQRLQETLEEDGTADQTASLLLAAQQARSALERGLGITLLGRNGLGKSFVLNLILQATMVDAVSYQALDYLPPGYRYEGDSEPGIEYDDKWQLPHENHEHIPWLPSVAS